MTAKERMEMFRHQLRTFATVAGMEDRARGRLEACPESQPAARDVERCIEMRKRSQDILERLMELEVEAEPELVPAGCVDPRD